MVWLFFGPTFSILGIISRNRKIFFALLTLPHNRPWTYPPHALSTPNTSAVKTQRNQVGSWPAAIFFDQVLE